MLGLYMLGAISAAMLYAMVREFAHQLGQPQPYWGIASFALINIVLGGFALGCVLERILP